MDNLPREHGLIVSWLLTVLAGVLLSSQFRPYGIVLTLLLIPTLFVYDRLIVGLRLWSIGKLGISRVLKERVGLPSVLLLSVVLVCVVGGLLLGLMPWLPVLATGVVLALEGAAFGYLRERHVLTRAVSILTVTSQFLLVNSGLSGGVSEFEIAAFVMLSLVNVVLVVDVVELVEASKIAHPGPGTRLPLRADTLFFAGSVIITLLVSAISSLYYLSFVALLLATQAALRSFAIGRSMKVIGVTSSVVEVVALVLLLVRFYGLA
jgi:hypothetical protein